MSGSAAGYGTAPGVGLTIELNPGRRTTTLRVSSTGDRAVLDCSRGEEPGDG